MTLRYTPIQFRGSSIPKESLRGFDVAKDSVAVWQPLFSFAQADGRLSFGQLKETWFVYQYHPLPVRARSPLIQYRLPAGHLGTRGIGFWSGSDKAVSSAWSDFDGHRSDWAVVYKSHSGPIPNVHCKTFREGVDELSMLAAASKTSNATSNICWFEQIRHRVEEVIKRTNDAHVQLTPKSI